MTATARATIPLKYQPQRYYCTDTVNPDCQKGFISAAGLNHHYNAVHKHHTTRPSHPQQHPWQPTGQHDGSGDDNEPQRPYYVKHPVLDGTPVGLNGDDFPEGASPPKPNTPSKRTWHPFESRANFELADFIFHQNEMPGAQIDELMHIWASMPGQAVTPPYANHEHLYSTIDAISEGDAPWTSFSMQSVEAGGSGGPSWKHSVFGEKGQCVWSDFMTGNWPWNQCNELSKDPDNHGAMFVPIILGSDKTTVSVATGNNEYYPLYISAGNVHNGMRHAHGEAVSLLGFLSIPETDKEFEADPEFCTFQRHLFHTSLEAIFHAMHPAMIKPQSFKDGAQTSFPCANTHELIAPDILHQIIKGKFKHHLVSWWTCQTEEWCPMPNANDTLVLLFYLGHATQTPATHCHTLPLTLTVLPPHASPLQWVEKYLKKCYKNDFAAVLADIDRWYIIIALVPPFPGLQHFSQGCGFKQWTGNDSKALMKSSLGEADLEALDRALQHFETHHSIFEAEGIHSDGILIPQIHALQHYHEAIELFGAPNGLSMSIVESKHIHAVKRPYQ
ncbi:hypothetical protein EDC04DRAFT_2609066 [Pisolithus marmoratus]|nr:hypothetical protein EDC04DRAFT_2609066 [Pisolithus marmoratus]